MLAWAATGAVFATCAIVTLTYARTFGERRFNILVWTWSFGLAQTFTVQEPLLIWLTLGIPWLVERFSHNDLASELVNAFAGSVLGNCAQGLLGLCAK